MPNCPHCKKPRTDDQFLSKKMRPTKLCSVCREHNMLGMIKYKETHGKFPKVNNVEKYNYKCPHGKSKYKCIQCDGRSMCHHGRQECMCAICNPNYRQKKRLQVPEPIVEPPIVEAPPNPMED